MATERLAGGRLVEWYRDRIAEPRTDDEVTGYWLFAVGVVLGILGILLFLVSAPAGSLRQWSIVVAAAGLTLLLAGPIVRLPLRGAANRIVGVGVAICALATLWFLVAFPAGWSTTSGQPWIIGLYAFGLLVMAAAGVFIPLLRPGPDPEAFEALVAERDAAEAAVAGTEADEADLAAELRSLRESEARFEIYHTDDDEWRWQLRHRNGNRLAESGRGYTQRHNAQNGMESVQRNALGASVLLLDAPPDPGDEGAAFAPADELESRATFEVYEDAAGEWRWRLVHDNGNIVADGSEGYATRRNVDVAVENVAEYVGPAEYLRPDPTAFEVFRDRAGAYRWRLVHRNGNVLADGGGGYSRRRDAARAIARLQEASDDYEGEVYEDAAGEWRWRLRAGNQQIVADSGEGYASRSGGEDALDRVLEYAPDAAVLDVGRAAFEVYEDEAGEWRWRLRHRNGNIIADSGGGYADRTRAWGGIESVKRNAPNAPVEAGK